MTINPIAVGVDGSPSSCAALLWAVDECRLRRRTLLVVYVADSGEILLDGAGIRALHEQGERVLVEATAAASARQPGVAVTSRLSHGRAADVLTEVSVDAELLVLGTRGPAALATALGSVGRAVAARAHCPVALVPDRIAAGRLFAKASLVVGLSASWSGRLALQFALDEAGRRNLPVRAVWATDCASGQAPPLHLERLRHPDVAVSIETVEAAPAEALLRASVGAALVVVGGHHSDDRWTTRLGPVPATLIAQLGCPMVVVGEARREPACVGGALRTGF